MVYVPRRKVACWFLVFENSETCYVKYRIVLFNLIDFLLQRLLWSGLFKSGTLHTIKIVFKIWKGHLEQGKNTKKDSLNFITRGRILGRNPDKSLKSFPPCYSSHLYSFALRFLFLQTHATSCSFYCSLITVSCKGERRKTWQKTTTPSLWFKKSIQ